MPSPVIPLAPIQLARSRMREYETFAARLLSVQRRLEAMPLANNRVLVDVVFELASLRSLITTLAGGT